MTGFDFFQWCNPSTTEDIATRLVKAQEYAECQNNCSGNYGKMTELLLTNSTCNHGKTDISPAGMPDFYIQDTVKQLARPVECKTNGGAIDCLFRLTKEQLTEQFFVYYYNICNKNTRYENWEVKPLIFTYKDFIDLLVSVNAIKQADGCSNPTIKIQCGTKKFYEALQGAEFGIPYVYSHNYTIINGHAIDTTK